MMIDETIFDDIRPYRDEEIPAAMHRIADNDLFPLLSSFAFPDRNVEDVRAEVRSISTVYDFQKQVMWYVNEQIVKRSMSSYTVSGIENLDPSGHYLFVSNHRDIILDPAITQVVLYQNGMQTTEIAVGSNLLSNPYVEALIRSNRMIKVIRGINARSLYLSSQLLSKYIRTCITSGKSSIWIAQREGRTKNGIDTTEQGLLKMLDMSGTKDFTSNFGELNIIPLSISYEYEPCDIMKAREQLISRTQKYVKAPKEDLISIMTGIQQQKGNIHLNIGEPLTHDEIQEASNCTKNDRYQAIRHAVDIRVIEGYKLWKTNYIAYDLLNHSYKYSRLYSPADVESFTSYIEQQLDKVEKSLNRSDLREILLGIYSNPVSEKEKLAASKA